MSRLQNNLSKLNRHLQVDDKLVYSDIHNYMEFTVLEVNKNLFTTVNMETGEIKERDLLCLQYGWDFESSYFKEIELLAKK
jgi:hypothetical protein